MLNDKGGAFMALEIDIYQTGGNIKILHLKFDYFCTGIPSTRSLFSTSEDVQDIGGIINTLGIP